MTSIFFPRIFKLRTFLNCLSVGTCGKHVNIKIFYKGVLFFENNAEFRNLKSH